MHRRVLTLLLVFLAPAAWSQSHDMFIFPNDGQDGEQQELDEFQCLRLAREQTGFDPMATPRATTAAPQQRGGVVGGAARGALLGTAIGAATGNTRRGLQTGAAGGGVIGGLQRADSNAQRDQWAREEAANYRRERERWTRAFTACMESRGYTVR